MQHQLIRSMALGRSSGSVVLFWILLLSSRLPLYTGADASILVSVDKTSVDPGGIYFYQGDGSSVTKTSPHNFTQLGLSNVLFTSMDVNVADGSIFFYNKRSKCIHRLHLGKVDNVHCGVSYSIVITIAYDWISGNIYWTDTFFKWIAVQPAGTADRTMYRVIIQDDIEEPRALAVDSNAGYMFWFEKSPSGFRIERALLDGTDRVPIITTSLLNVRDIEIDAGERRLYWTDSWRYAIQSSLYDGTDRKIVYKRLNEHLHYIAVDTEHVCATVYKKHGWMCIVKSTGSVDLYRTSEFKSTYPNVITMFKDGLRPDIPDGCQTLGCEHFCVNRQPNGQCVCKEGYTLNTDGLHCTENQPLYNKAIVVSNATNICMVSSRTVPGHGDPLLCVGNVVQGCQFLTVDTSNKLIYYVDTTANVIREYNLVTDTIRQVTPVSTVSGIAFDWIDGNLYWSESTGKLKYVTIATSAATELVQADSPPSHLTIDPHSSNEKTVALEQASPAYIKDIFFDVSSDRLYFVESNRLSSITRNGSDTQHYKYGFMSVARLIIYKRYAIWTETTSSRVYSIHLHYTFRQTTKLAINFGMISGLAVYDEALQRQSKGPCSHLNGGCEQVCMTGITGSAVCACSFGMTLQLDRKSCGSVPQSSNFLLVPDLTGGRLFQISTTDAQITALDINRVGRPLDVVFDPETSFVFWSDLTSNNIMRSTLDGSNVDTVYTVTGMSTNPAALAMDYSTGNLYYTVSGKADTILPGSVGVLKPSTGLAKSLVKDLHYVNGLVLYPSKGLMFYTNDDYPDDTFSNILRAPMDGTSPNAIVALDPSDFLTNLAVDFITDRLYWSSSYGGVGSSSLTGSARTKFTTSFTRIRSIAVVGDFLYLSSENKQKIVKMNLRSKTEVPFMTDNAELGFLLNIFVYPEQAQPVSSVCSSNNGGCSTFCLPKASTFSSYCACEDGTDLKLDDPYTCQGVTRCPTDIPNGKFKDPCIRNADDVCTFQCNSGYMSTVSSKTVTCGQDGQWNENMQQLCQLRPICPSAIPNGTFDEPCTRYAPDECTFQCNSGYRSTLSSKTVTCGQDGQWNENMQLLCQPIPNGMFEVPCTRYAPNVCTFQCNSGYMSTISVKSVTCGQDGQWNENMQLLCQHQTTPTKTSTYVYIGSGLAGFIVISVIVVTIVVKKRQRLQGQSDTRGEPDVYYTRDQLVPHQDGALASGVVNLDIPDKTKRLPTVELPTPPDSVNPDNTYVSIPDNSEYSEPTPHYEECTIQHDPSVRSESSVVSVQRLDSNYLTLMHK